MKVDHNTGHKWNNLTASPEISINAVVGIKLDN